MKNINLTVDDNPLSVPEGTTIMKAAETIGVYVPRLCYVPDLGIEGACRICIVEVEGYDNYLTACSTKVEEGMKVKTNSPVIRQARRDLVELILDNHPMDCQTCERDGNCELQDLAYSLGVRERLFAGQRKHFEVDNSSFSVVRNSDKCILCYRCIRVCAEVQGVTNLGQMNRGVNTVVGPAHLVAMKDSVCINCGQCINVCPTAAFLEKSATDEVWAVLADPKKHVVAQIAPSIRATIGEGFGEAPGTAETGRTVTALRRLGFDAVFDTNFGADLTIVEESEEFISRLKHNGILAGDVKEDEKKTHPLVLPMFTSCSPGWVSFMEHFYPEMIPHMSSCRSPMSMQSIILKTFYARKTGIDPKDICVVAIMPCTAKKYEMRRPELYDESGSPYTDAVLTTRELVWMIKAYGIDFMQLHEEEFDNPLGSSTGAADIFGTTGGVMEAALRTAAEKITGEPLDELNFYDVRAVTGYKEASVNIAGIEVNIAVVNGLNNAKKILEKVKSGEKQYHLIELMACPGGCIGGGGQPYPADGRYVLNREVLEKRAASLYKIDAEKKIRKSHDNPYIQQLYQQFLQHPGSEIAHELLHTTYEPKEPRGIK
ncbi:MAG: iron hydrogenase small subunit [Clostridiales bacterium]|nr:iron hydrogenase small subunit [Clostridiales bacterium]